MPKFSKSRDKRVFGYSLFFGAPSDSSKRTRAAVKAMFVELHRELSGTAIRRENKKQKIFAQMKTHPEGTIAEDPASFDGRKFPFAPSKDMQLYDDVKEGFVHWLDKDNMVFSCCVVPETWVRQHLNQRNTDDVTHALDVLQSTESNCKRGKNQTGVSTDSRAKCATFGCKCPQQKGFTTSKTSQKDPASAEILERWTSRLGHLAAKVIPAPWLRAIKVATSLTNAPIIKGGGNLFGAALASTVNYNAPAHVDDDFFLSIHQLNVKGRLFDDSIAQYFCFPTCGFAVGLRPGCVLLFNPHVHHCLSEKSEEYMKDRVHVSTIYLKSKHVSQNNKDAHLSAEEMVYFALEI